MSARLKCEPCLSYKKKKKKAVAQITKREGIDSVIKANKHEYLELQF